MSDIVLADDEYVVRTNLRQFFESLGHRVFPAINGKEALKAILSAQAEGTLPELLVSDLQMTDMDGEVLLAILQAKGIQIPSIVISAHLDKEMMIRLMRLGCRDVIEKPFPLEELKLRIDALLKASADAADESQTHWKQRNSFCVRVRQLIHDVNNLLGIGIGYTELALDRAEDIERVRTCLSRVSNASREATRLLSNALELKLSEAVSERKPTEVRQLVDNAAMLLNGLLPEQIVFLCELEPREYFVHADPERIHQAILNLGLNAVDAMPNGGTLRIWVKCEPEKAVVQNATFLFEDDRPHPKEYVTIAVQDSGVGIARDIVHRVFEKGFTTKMSGSGIGLWIVKEVVSEHIGALSVVSGPSAGTTVTMSFPLTE